MINSLTKYNNLNNRTEYNAQSNPSFKAYMPQKVYYYAEKAQIKGEFVKRKLVNRLLEKFVKIKMWFKKLFNIEEKPITSVLEVIPKTEHGMKNLKSCEISKILSDETEVEINVENDELHNITEDDASCIFIMNHDKQRKDPKLLSFFNALLLRDYLFKGKGDHCPSSKIIINKDILESASEEKRELAKEWGAVGIDAAIHSADKIKNGKIMSEIVKGLANDEINLFIFPEGRMCAFKNMAPDWKFQSGIGDIVKAVAQRKNKVKIVPLGFAYKGTVGGIHIGEPIYFKKEGDQVLFKNGIIDKKTQNKTFTDFIENAPSKDGWYTISENGTPIKSRESGEYIAGILCENLTSSKILAEASLKDVGTEKDAENILYTFGGEINE